MKKYLAFFKLGLKLTLSERGRALVWLGWDVLPPIIMLFFWQAAFLSQENIAGYSLSSMLVYYLLVMFIRTIIFTHPDEALQREINNGKLSSYYLTKPIDTLLVKMFFELGYKVFRFLLLMPIIFGFLWFYPAALGNLNLDAGRIFYFLNFIVFSFILCFLIRLSTGLATFWFGEIHWLMELVDLLLLLFGGTLFPLEFLPRNLYNLAYFLPFRFEVFIPTKIFLGKIQNWEYWQAFFMQLIWILIFYQLVKVLWKKGIKVYAAYGD